MLTLCDSFIHNTIFTAIHLTVNIPCVLVIFVHYVDAAENMCTHYKCTGDHDMICMPITSDYRLTDTVSAH
jgi:hypothetical protein